MYETYEIELSYHTDFIKLMKGLRFKYGQGLFDLDGIGHQLDINSFSKKYFKSNVASDASIDANANVDDTSVIAYNTEMSKPLYRLDSYYLLWKELIKFLPLARVEHIIEAQLRGDFYIHDFHGISGGLPYCFNYSTLDIVANGLPMVKKISSYPPKHLYAFKSQLEQFITVASKSTLGATGMADMLISMSYYMAHILETKSDAHFHFLSEEDCWTYAKENLVSFIYTVNQPMRGEQSPFTNISLYDRPFLENVTSGIVFPDGSTPNLEIIERLQIIYMDIMNEELKRTPITFPVTTACFAVDDGKILDPKFNELISKKNKEFGFINIYMGNKATLSSCCRLRSSTSNEFFNSFGAGSSKIGSLGVCTINFPRLAFLSKTKEEFEENLREAVKISTEINEAKRRIIQKRIDGGHAPLYSLYFMEISKQYSTTGINGLYEALGFLGESILTEDGQDYVAHIMQIVNDELDDAQKLFNAPHNCEQVPGENASIKLCAKDKYLGYQMGLEFYSNQFIPLTVSTDMINRIVIQGKLDKYFSGGSILHLNIDDGIEDWEDLYELTELCAKVGVVYYAVNYLLNRCVNGHMTIGKTDTCAVCGEPIEAHFTRVVGFLTQVDFWHKVRRELDFPFRVFHAASDLEKLV